MTRNTPATADATEERDPTRTSDGTLVARLLPAWGRDEDPADVEIVVYVVTGKHGGLRIPESFCRECNLFVRAADQAAEGADADVSVRVVSWYTHVLSALRHGGWHAPVMVVGGKRLCQGYDVPTVEEVGEAIEAALEA